MSVDSGQSKSNDSGDREMSAVALDAGVKEELFALVGSVCDGTLNEQEKARLIELLANPEARSIYRRYINLHATVRAYHAHDVEVDFESIDSIESIEPPSKIHGEDHSPENIAALNTMSRINSWIGKRPPKGEGSGEGNDAVDGSRSYGRVAKVIAVVTSAAAVLLLAINLLQPTPVPPVPVAVISGTHHAQWLDERDRLVFLKEGQALLPQTLRLGEGLAEIKFNNGAVVVLDARERQTTFIVSTEKEAFLELGKITARAEPESAKGFTVGVPGNQRVIDVSTEFGIIVDDQGHSEVHVIDGAVDLAQTNEDGTTTTLRMSQGQAVQLEKIQIPAIAIERSTQEFLASLPVKVVKPYVPKPSGSKPDPADLSVGPVNTGKGLAAGQDDPNWRIIAAKNVPGFQPKQAVVCVPLSNFRPNDPLTSQWLSNSANLPAVPANAVMTFQTKMTLSKQDVKSRRLRVRYIADNVLAGVRLNGKVVDISSKTELESFVEFSLFNINDGFVPGENTLEFIVGNAGIGNGGANPMAFCVEFEWINN